MSAPPEIPATAKAESPDDVMTGTTENKIYEGENAPQVQSGDASVPRVDVDLVNPASEVHPASVHQGNADRDAQNGPVDGIDTIGDHTMDGNITDSTTDSGTIEGKTPGQETDPSDELPSQQNKAESHGEQSENGDNSDDSDSSSDTSSSDTESEDEVEVAAGATIEDEPEDNALGADARVPKHFLPEEDEAAKNLAEPLRTKNESEHKPLPKPDLKIQPGAQLIRIGPIHSIVGTSVTISADPGASTEPLDAGTVLCTEDRTVIGALMDTFGPASKPFYVVGFENREEIARLGLAKGQIIYHPVGLAQHIRVSDIKKQKGYDTSNRDDEEGDVSDGFYSDDEAESAHVEKARKHARAGDLGQRRGGLMGRTRNAGPGNLASGQIGFPSQRGRGGHGARGGHSGRQGHGDRNRGPSGRAAPASNLDYGDSADYTPLRRPTSFATGQSLPPRPANTRLPSVAPGGDGYSGRPRNDRNRRDVPRHSHRSTYQDRQDSDQPPRQHDSRSLYAPRNNPQPTSYSGPPVTYNGHRDSYRAPYNGRRDSYDGHRDARDGGRNEPRDYGRRHDDHGAYDRRPNDRGYPTRHEVRSYDHGDGHARTGYTQGGYNNAQSHDMFSAAPQPAGAYGSGITPHARPAIPPSPYINPATGLIWGQQAPPVGLSGVPALPGVMPQQTYQAPPAPPQLSELSDILAVLRDTSQGVPLPPPGPMPVGAPGHHSQQGQQGQQGQQSQQGQQQHHPGDQAFTWGQQFSRY